MKCTMICKTEDYKTSVEVTLGDSILRFHDGEPEDNSIMRNFSDVLQIQDLIEKAYQLGRQGITLDFDYEEIDDQWS